MKAKASDARASLTKLDKARRLLAECQSIDEAKNIRDQAEAMRVYCKQQADSLDAQNYAAEIKLRAERKCGQLLAAMDKRNGDPSLHDERRGLAELGISYSQSHRWQTEAAVPEDVFEQFVRGVHEGGKELTSSALYKLGKKTLASDVDPEPEIVPLRAPAESRVIASLSEIAGESFGCIYADPPWKYGNQATRAATSDHYPTLTVDELCEWPVGEIAADDAHLHLWTTNAFLFDSRRVLEAWGFEYRSCFIWVKPQMGIGNYWRVSHEFLILGIRGNAKRFNNRSLRSWAEFERGRHSSKPEQVRGYIEMASPGPYIELFGRTAIEGWTVLGNQVENRLFA